MGSTTHLFLSFFSSDLDFPVFLCVYFRSDLGCSNVFVTWDHAQLAVEKSLNILKNAQELRPREGSHVSGDRGCDVSGPPTQTTCSWGLPYTSAADGCIMLHWYCSMLFFH